MCATATRSSPSLRSTCARPGREPGGTAVTVMTNYGFHGAMEEAGIEVATTKVGDRHVIEELLERGWTIGGEQSGHVIWTEFAPTGDGIAAALLVMEALGDRDLAAVEPFEKLPQRLENVRLPKRGGARRTRPRSGRRSSARGQSSRGVAGCSCARRAPSRWSG